MHVVTKPFNTLQRRFRLGAEVSETDDLSPHTFDDLNTRGFIADKSNKQPQRIPDRGAFVHPVKPSGGFSAPLKVDD